MNIYNPTYWKANFDLFKTQYQSWSNEIKKSQLEAKRIESELSVYQKLSNDMHQLNKMLPSMQYDNGITNAFNLTPELFNLLKGATLLQWIKDASKALKLTEFQKENLELTNHCDLVFTQRAIGNKSNLESKLVSCEVNTKSYQGQFNDLLGRIEDTISHFRKIIRNNQHLNTNNYNVEGFSTDITLESLIKQFEGDSNE